MSDSFSPHIEAVARAYLGEPNKDLSTPTELRFGSHGSMSVDLERGVWNDHESKVGGGVLDLICREGVAKTHGEAADVLKRDFGADLPDERREAPREPQKIVATYDYVSEDGEVLFQVVRYQPKTFRQRKPDGSGWSWKVKDVRQVPYHLPELLKAPKKRAVFVLEGEKDVEAWRGLGFVATCNAGGAGKWPAGLSEHFAGRDVVIVPDNDEPGRLHAQLVAASLKPVASRVRILNLPGLGLKQDPSDWIAAGGTRDQAVALADQAPEYAESRPPTRFGAIYWNDIDNHPPRSDWLAEDLMFRGDVGMLYGASSSGKSFLAVTLGLSIALGVPFMGKKVAQGGVIYQAGEGGKGIIKRLHAYRLRHHVYTPDVPFVLLPERLNLFNDGESVDAFIAECQMHQAAMTVPLQVVFIDTFSTASTGANENASEDVSPILAAGERIAKALGCALIWVHHKNASGEKARGHTSIGANVDTAIEVIRDEQTSRREAHLKKLKDGEDGTRLFFELEVVEIGRADDGKPITSCVVVPSAAPVSEAAAFKLPGGHVRYLRALDQAIARNGAQLPPLDGIPDRQIGVDMKVFRRIYGAMNGDDKKPEAVRQAASRDTTHLVNMGLIGVWEGWIWLTPKGELQVRF